METGTTARPAWELNAGVRIEVFPERDGNEITPPSTETGTQLVRIEVFPERDGNLSLLLEECRDEVSIVRIEVFPERDGNWRFEWVNF